MQTVHLSDRTRVRVATLRDLTYVAANCRDIDRKEIEASAAVTPWEAAIVTHYAGQQVGGAQWVVDLDDNPEVVFGMLRSGDLTPWVLNGWMWGTSKTPLVMPSLMRFARDNWRKTAVETLEATRIEVRSIEDHVEAHRWLEWAGCRRECVLTDYGRNRERFVQFAWCLEDHGGDHVFRRKKGTGPITSTSSPVVR